MAEAVGLVVGEVANGRGGSGRVVPAARVARQLPAQVFGEQLGKAPAQNVRPMTAARSRRRRSTSGRRSSRAARSAPIVGGIGSSARSDPRGLRSAGVGLVRARRRRTARRTAGCPRRRPRTRVRGGRAAAPARADRAEVAASASSSASRRAAPQGRPSQPVRTHLLELRTCDGDQEERTAAEIEDVPEQLDQDRLGPLEVVDEQDQRAFSGEGLEEAPDRPADLLARDRSSVRPDDRRDPVAHEVGPVRPGDDGLKLGQRRHPRLAGARCPSRREDELSDRPVGDPLAVRQAARAQDRGPLGDPGEGLGDEAALADAGRADDRDQARHSLRERPARTRRAGRRARLLRPTNGVVVRRTIASPSVEGHQANGRRDRSPVVAPGWHRLRRRRCPDQPFRLRRQQHLSGAARRGESGRCPERRTGERRYRPVAPAGQDLAGRDADADE